MTQRLVLLELNEINFDIVCEYIEAGYGLPNLQRLMDRTARLTVSEAQYELLEPWIQWPSVHTGMPFDGHTIFRLGDAALKRPIQFFELIERAGFKVGAISPMNAINSLETPAYFIPDPWTNTSSDPSILSRMLTSALRQTVNDNSEQKVSLQSSFFLVVCFFFLVRPRSYLKLLVKAFRSRRKPWRKALFLDRFLHEIHSNLFFKKKAEFSTLFLNAGAHIQHHYLLNSKSESASSGVNPEWYAPSQADPVLEMLHEYDEIMGDLLGYKDVELLVATGLSQKPVNENIFYYRLKNHEDFISRIGIPVVKIEPRMTRDFLITCSNEEQCKQLEVEISKIVTRSGRRLFGHLDNRGLDLFVTLDYPFEITKSLEISLGGEWYPLWDDVVFVAVKNGEHDGRGFAYFSPGLQSLAPEENHHVSNLFFTVCGYFGLNNARG